jgi:hypothetical protein
VTSRASRRPGTAGRRDEAGSRNIITAAELAEHKITAHGRDYRLSDDGYGDREVAEKQGWHAVSSWGRDGWDLGSWPYVVIYIREENGTAYEMQQIVEGDHTVYRFSSEEDRNAAIDYLFLWYAADQHWAPITCDQREALDIGYPPLAITDKWRGPFSWSRLEAEKQA